MAIHQVKIGGVRVGVDEIVEVDQDPLPPELTPDLDPHGGGEPHLVDDGRHPELDVRVFEGLAGKHVAAVEAKGGHEVVDGHVGLLGLAGIVHDIGDAARLGQGQQSQGVRHQTLVNRE